MDRSLNVLIYPSGSEGALEIFHALKDVVNITVYGASSRQDHGAFVFGNYIEGIPAVSDPGFIGILNQRISELQIDAIFPCHDTVALFLAEHRERINATVVCSESATAQICRSKKMIYARLAGEECCPLVYSDPAAIVDFPVFMKPDIGEGGRNARSIATPAELKSMLAARDGGLYVFTEMLPGDEYTVDCFTDRRGELRFAGARTRERITAGITMHSEPVDGNEFQVIASAINAAMKLRGLWFFQVKRDAAGKLKLLEVSVRAASTMCVYRQLGVNLPLLALYDAFGYDVSVFRNKFRIEMDRALMARYRTNLEYESVYIDFDDTIIQGEHVNRTAVSFLYQCREQGKRTILITRHAGDLRETLKRKCISEGLFDVIIHLRENEEKYPHITDSKVIFIDNAYAERKKVYTEKSIPVFDVDSMACLIDWKE